MVPFFNNNSPSSRHFLRDKIVSKKLAREMSIKQVIEFELRGPRPPGRTCTPITVYFHDEAKTFKKNIPVDYYLLLKYCRRQCTLLHPT